jgi:tRNA/rRNA methyltransferase/tRNA (cytidine32/uridine32-2'-O)-methyltransferase
VSNPHDDEAHASLPGMAELARRVRIVLVNCQHTGNIGSAARAMKTMGLRRLVLVNPVEFPSREASWRAVHAQDLLTAAVVVPTLAEAVADCSYVIGTSVRERRLALPLLDAREAAQVARGEAARGEVAIVFGRETSGLSEDELMLSNRQLCIPTDPDYPSLNLAMAVQLVAYELRMTTSPNLALRPRVAPAGSVRDQAEVDGPATSDALRHLLGHAEATFSTVGYHDPARPRLLLPRLRRLFARAGLLASEVRLLRGALSAVDAALAARAHAERSGEPVDEPPGNPDARGDRARTTPPE